MLKFEEIKEAIENAPMTYAPALLTTAAETAIRKGCFIEGGASNAVARIENNLNKDKCEEEKDTNSTRSCVLTCGRCHSAFFLPEENIHRKCGLNGCHGRLHKL